MLNLSDRGFVVDRAVFIPSIAFLLSTVGIVLLFPEASGAAFGTLQATIVENASWFYGIVMAILLVASVVLAFSRVGTIPTGSRQFIAGLQPFLVAIDAVCCRSWDWVDVLWRVGAFRSLP